MASGRVEQLPCNDEVDGWVTDREAAEVEHRGQLALANEQALRAQVAVQLPRREDLLGTEQRHGCLPNLQAGRRCESQPWQLAAGRQVGDPGRAGHHRGASGPPPSALATKPIRH